MHSRLLHVSFSVNICYILSDSNYISTVDLNATVDNFSVLLSPNHAITPSSQQQPNTTCCVTPTTGNTFFLDNLVTYTYLNDPDGTDADPSSSILQIKTTDGDFVERTSHDFNSDLRYQRLTYGDLTGQNLQSLSILFEAGVKNLEFAAELWGERVNLRSTISLFYFMTLSCLASQSLNVECRPFDSNDSLQCGPSDVTPLLSTSGESITSLISRLQCNYR